MYEGHVCHTMDSIVCIAETVYIDGKFDSGALVQWKRKGDAWAVKFNQASD